jgi:hypothetical protein
MISKEKVKKFIESQQSIQFYQKVKNAFYDVLIDMPEEQFEIVTDNLIIMALHE